MKSLITTVFILFAFTGFSGAENQHQQVMDCNCPQDPNIIPIYDIDVNEIMNESGQYFLFQNDVKLENWFFLINESNDITLDLNGYEITGFQPFPAIQINHSNNITIKNGRINNAGIGLVVQSDSNNIHIENLTIENCFQEGINISSICNDIYLNNITCKNNEIGIKITRSNNYFLENITVTGNRDDGIIFGACDYLYINHIEARENASDNIDFSACSWVYIDDANSSYAGDNGMDLSTVFYGIVSNSSFTGSQGMDLKVENGSKHIFVRNCKYNKEQAEDISRVSTLNLTITNSDGNPIPDAEVWIESIQDVNNPVLKYLLRADYKGDVSTDVTQYTRRGGLTHFNPFDIDITHPDYASIYFVWDDPNYFPLKETIVLEPKQ